MFRAVIPVRQAVRDPGLALLIAGAVAAFSAVRHGA